MPDRCYFGTSPSLATINKTYGNTASVQWLIIMITHLNEYSAARKMDSYQIEMCARAINTNYYYLKASELMLFFSRLIGGIYGKVFYGSVDPTGITAALHDSFIPERELAYQKMEREKRMSEIERQRATPPTNEERRKLQSVIDRVCKKFGIDNKDK